MSVIRAAEVGFGTTSVVVEHTQRLPKIKTFPSFVSVHRQKDSDMSAGLNRRDTVLVEVEGQTFEVGPDAYLSATKSASRVVNESYIDSTQYKALLKAALHYINQPVVDLLVLALPYEHWHRRDGLKKLVIGDHVVAGKKIKVIDAWVLPQPLAGMLSYANSLGQEMYKELAEEIILSVDCGYGTFDWVISTGLKINAARSGGHEQGMNAVLSECSKELRTAFPNISDYPLQKIDEAFYKHPYIKVAGKRYSFPVSNEGVKFDLTNSIDTVTEGAITQLKNVVGSGGDIDRIVLMGGASKVYLKALKKAYPAHEIIVLENAITSVCQGMQIGGKQFYEKQKKKGVAA